MRSFRPGIVDQRVGCHLKTALGACPFLGRVHQFPADSLAAMPFANEPSLDESDGLPRIAAIGVRTQANFKKAKQLSALVVRNQRYDWKLRLPRFELARFHLREVFLLGSIRPEQARMAASWHQSPGSTCLIRIKGASYTHAVASMARPAGESLSPSSRSRK
jgi:hypothetical protein